jgi:hypothetical protein
LHKEACGLEQAELLHWRASKLLFSSCKRRNKCDAHLSSDSATLYTCIALPNRACVSSELMFWQISASASRAGSVRYNAGLSLAFGLSLRQIHRH